MPVMVSPICSNPALMQSLLDAGGAAGSSSWRREGLASKSCSPHSTGRASTSKSHQRPNRPFSATQQTEMDKSKFGMFQVSVMVQSQVSPHATNSEINPV